MEHPVRSRQASQDEGSRLLGEPVKISFSERIKPKVSLCLGTTAALSFMVFLFLVPFVVDPAVSRLIARYSPEPGTCALHEHIFAAGLSKCTWSSCREGCTSATTRCHQITVNYSLTPFEEYYQNKMHPKSLKWAGTVVRFLVNTEGCGYPPYVNCTVFALKYGHMEFVDFSIFENINQSETRALYRHYSGNNTDAMDTMDAMNSMDPMDAMDAAISLSFSTKITDSEMPTIKPTNNLQMNTISNNQELQLKGVRQKSDKMGYHVFPCYYSRAYPDRVVAEYNWYHTIKMLVAAVVIPWTLFFVSCAILCYWYCPALKKEFMIGKKKTAANKIDKNSHSVNRRLSEQPFSTDEDDGGY